MVPVLALLLLPLLEASADDDIAPRDSSRPAFWRLVVRQSHLATCRETIAPAFPAQAACRNKTALVTSLTATVVPCARAVCYTAPTCTRLAAQHNNWLSLSPRHS